MAAKPKKPSGRNVSEGKRGTVATDEPGPLVAEPPEEGACTWCGRPMREHPMLSCVGELLPVLHGEA